MAEGRIVTEQDGAVGRIVFDNRERHNAVSRAMWEALADAVDDFVRDEEVRVIVLRGAGDKAFVSGADISRFGDERGSAEAVARYDQATARALRTLDGALKPTLAMIDGYCLGGGVSIAVACDLRIASDRARFGVPAARLGLAYGIEQIRRLMAVIGPAAVKEMLITARRFSAAEAAAMGLVHRVVPAAELEAAIGETAAMLAANAPLTIAAVKAAVAELVKDEGGRDLARVTDLIRACYASEDYVEGQRAFAEKREPRFKGR